ncbi:TRAP transporter substrate-binding protein [Pseudovibrio exalbescens]|uniref:TRAP transporter substrate-binding protein n=1 Tax=Pseudovibrio exalbescens TaxID=197461 RepID=UPI002365A093|nr:TRAP transporter substrate-binding protein [Pseudovibrio exalbescens]MDD7910774.1 TRAP transporter substrate-binding protein [Pseudovibrio exalbescens]
MRATPFLLSFVISSCLVASSVAANTKLLRLSHNLPTANPAHVSLEFLADRVKELTDGDLRIRVFPEGELGTQKETVLLMQEGLLDMARSNAAEMEAFEPAYAVMNLPYVFESEQHYYDVLTSDIADEILEASRGKGFIGLAFMVDGSRSFYANTPINSPKDLEGMRIRVQPAPSSIQMVELLGGTPTPISFGELYSALQTGLVDGAENNPRALIEVRHGEVAKVYSQDEHTMIPGVLMISTRVWDTLPKEQQEALRQAAREMMDYHRALYNAQTEKVIEEARTELGVEFVSVNKEAFIEAVQPMYEELAGRSEQMADLLQRINAKASQASQ